MAGHCLCGSQKQGHGSLALPRPSPPPSGKPCRGWGLGRGRRESKTLGDGHTGCFPTLSRLCFAFSFLMLLWTLSGSLSKRSGQIFSLGGKLRSCGKGAPGGGGALQHDAVGILLWPLSPLTGGPGCWLASPLARQRGQRKGVSEAGRAVRQASPHPPTNSLIPFSSSLSQHPPALL